MNRILQQPRALDAVERQAHDWARRVAGGRMTHADGAALRRWCLEDPAHAAAFADARKRWAQLGAAGELVAARNPAARLADVRSTPNWQRRAFLGGALSAAAAVSAVAFVHPPLGLWPSAGELRADYRTAIGEQRRLALADDVAVELNTRTSIAVWSDAGRVSGIDLIAGEAAVDMMQARGRFAVVAGSGHTTAQNARFEVRHVAAGVCVTCVQGRVQVTHPGGNLILEAGQRLTYDDSALGTVAHIDTAHVSAWREGSLRFSDTPLGEVVDEINRYRPGRVVLLDRTMAAKAVTGRFRIDSLDKAIAQMQRSLGLTVRSLPGGMVLLS